MRSILAIALLALGAVAEPDQRKPQKGKAHSTLGIGSTKLSSKGHVEMVYVPKGTFRMGSENGEENPSSVEGEEKPARQIFLDAYWIGKNDVTVSQFRAYCHSTGYAYDWKGRKPIWGWLDDHPMVEVTWGEARAYCQWAGGDLPTEAQWEKAARGDDGRVYPWGNKFASSKLWSSKGSLGEAKSTAPVGSFPSGASPYGCLDMAGNVWQLCKDWYAEYDQDAVKNPTGPGFGTTRILRGGGWGNNAYSAFRCAGRGRVDPSMSSSDWGFRLASRS